jgi:carbamoyl-phosphate synthase small subunit
VIALKDGTVYQGRGFGSACRVSGEVVFNTGMVGYPEGITDPSYWGQILVQTYPLIGNYGICSRDLESANPKITGYAVSSLCRRPSHHSSEMSLDKWLTDNSIPGMEWLDTRAITKRLREKGTMLGVLEVSDHEIDIEKLRKEARKVEDPNQRDLTIEVSRKQVRHFGSGRRGIALLDCGTKKSIIDSMVSLGVRVTAYPVGTGFDEIMKEQPDGILISNGPGDPKNCRAVSAVREGLEAGLPTMGVCMGNQILGLAAGGDTYKLKFGHRSQNQPCMEVGSGRCYITTQNHGFAIDTKSLPRGWKQWFVNVNDGSNEGIRHETRPFMSVQFHPEAAPGPVDTRFIFKKFLKIIENGGKSW